MDGWSEQGTDATSPAAPISSMPLSPNMLLSLLQPDSSEEEHKRVLDRGYQKAVGCILWAARNVFPQTLYTVGQLCKVMSKPTEEAWSVAMQLIGWMHAHRHDHQAAQHPFTHAHSGGLQYGP